MKVKIANVKLIYAVLNKAHELEEEQDPTESWKKTEQDPDIEQIKRSSGVDYPPVELPYPLSHAKLFADRADSCYSAYVQISPRGGELVFRELSRLLIPKFQESGRIFSPSTSSGSGYVLDGKGNVRASIMDGSADNPLRDIGIGCNGARTRKFGDINHFHRAFRELEDYVNIYLDALYSPLVQAGMAIVPDATLYFNP